MKMWWLIILLGGVCHGMSQNDRRQVRSIFDAAAKGHAQDLEGMLCCAPHLKDYVHPKSGNTPLLVALKKENTKAARVLIDKQADPNIADKQGNTPLLIAVRSGDVEMIDALIDAGANVKARNNLGQSVISLAVLCGYISLIEKFRSDFYDELQVHGHDYIVASQKNGRMDLVAYLNRLGVAKQEFFKAVMEGDLQKVRERVSDGMPLAETFEKGNTALHYAVFYDHPIIALYLLATYPALAGMKNEKGQMPIDLAFYTSNVYHWLTFFVTATCKDEEAFNVWKEYLLVRSKPKDEPSSLSCSSESEKDTHEIPRLLPGSSGLHCSVPPSLGAEPYCHPGVFEPLEDEAPDDQ